MVVGESILKFRNYPFTYTFLIIFFNSINYSISENQILFLGVAGAVGTFLTIIDPVGIGVKELVKNNVKSMIKENPSSDITQDTYRLSAIKSRAINFETEKLVGLFYFMILIFVFMFAVSFTDFVKDINPKDSEKNPIFENNDLRMIVFFVWFFIFGMISIRIAFFWLELKEKIKIAGYHQFAINNDNATQSSVESMTRAVEQNDWGLAKNWQEKIKEEIKYKKGKRELIIKSADTVFSPLHLESSEFQKHLDEIKWRKQFLEFKIPQWKKIKQHSLQSIIEDTELRRRIENFYKLMSDYNNIVPSIFREMNKIINEKFSSAYNKSASSVEFHLDTPGSGNNVQLTDCAMSEIHPLDLNPNSNFGSIKLRIQSGRSVNYAEFTQKDIFDAVWKSVLDEVKTNEVIIKVKRYLSDLDDANIKLMKIYSEKIEMQWKV